jgi:ATP-dependent exoDNAse (exonuclease V) beta subunit
MKIKVITASAGSGKTTRLSEILDEAIGSGRVRVDGIVATTFTKEAAAELVERARSRLLASGRGREAHQLLASRIGTVNSVCGAIVTDFAFELGLSPALRVLDESSAIIEQQRALASVVSPAMSEELDEYKNSFDGDFDWRYEVRKLIEAARSNDLDASKLSSFADRSVAALDACLGPTAADGDAIDAAMIAAIDQAVSNIDMTFDTTKGTAGYVKFLEQSRRSLTKKRLRWGDWAKLGSEAPTAKSLAAIAPIPPAAARHVEHPRLRAEMHRLIRLMFQVAADGLVAYRQYKLERGLIDFVDQEALCLKLLRRSDVREALAGQLDLVLVDEFQDTSPLQLAIFLELAALARESVWVGDQKQAIYGFRGTDPALMDAVIESLSGTENDPELIQDAIEKVGLVGELESLEKSYRSRPELVHLTSDIFARAFTSQKIDEERTRLTPHLVNEPAGLGDIVEVWPLRFTGRESKKVLGAAAATGVRDLLARKPVVRDRATGEARPANARDVAVLCRTNDQCQHVANALADLGIAAVVPRMGLFTTAEGQFVSAALRLWLDAYDSLAAAELAHLVTYASDLDALVARALEAPGREAFADDPSVVAILAAREQSPDLDPLSTIDAVIDAANLRMHCAAWGNTAQRLANLDAIRAHAAAYIEKARGSREPFTLAGLLAHFDELVEAWGWDERPTDRQALVGGADAVTLSTWHAAKGREWPITVLFGLETLREPAAYGVHVESDATGFDVDAPLAGRWLRFWPNPYTNGGQKGPIKTAYANSAEHAAVDARAKREALRVLYVGWTRARDRIVLAACADKMTDGLLGTLVTIDPGLISEPANTQRADVTTSWAGRTIKVAVHPATGAPAVATSPTPGELNVGRPASTYPPARVRPSEAEPVACTVGTPVELGPRLTLRGEPNMTAVGDAIHAFLGADRDGLDETTRLALAESALRGFGVTANLDAPEVVAAGTRLRTWLAAMPALRVHREWPLAERMESGTVVTGNADLVASVAGGLVLVDHKSFPGNIAQALVRLPKYSGQLASYARALAAATGEQVLSTWIHLPIMGIAVQIQSA